MNNFIGFKSYFFVILTSSMTCCRPSLMACSTLTTIIDFNTMDPAQDTIRCPWKLGDKLEGSPHVHEPFRA